MSEKILKFPHFVQLTDLGHNFKCTVFAETPPEPLYKPNLRSKSRSRIHNVEIKKFSATQNLHKAHFDGLESPKKGSFNVIFVKNY